MFRYHRQERGRTGYRETGKKVLINKVFTRNFLVFTQFYLYAAPANDWRVVKTFIGFSGIDKIYEDPVDILWELGLDIFTAKLCPSGRVRVFSTRGKRALSILGSNV